MKVCTKCKDTKEFKDFYLRKYKSGNMAYNSWCNPCMNNASRNRTKGYYRKKDLKKFFGITLTDYENLLISQNYVCKICGQEEVSFDKRWKTVRRLAVDHCHATGRIRGLLCTRCNLLLGSIEKNRDLIEKLEDYLTKD